MGIYADSSIKMVSLIISSASLLAVGGFVALNLLPLYIHGTYIGCSIFTFTPYIKNKSVIESRTWRTPDYAHHLFSPAGDRPFAVPALRCQALAVDYNCYILDTSSMESGDTKQFMGNTLLSMIHRS